MDQERRDNEDKGKDKDVGPETPTAALPRAFVVEMPGAIHNPQ